MSLRNRRYIYIGQTVCIRRRLQQHNSGHGAIGTQSQQLRPFAVLAYICGFDGNRYFRESIERKWKQKRNVLMINGVNDPRDIVRSGHNVISKTSNNTRLGLICLFRNN